MLLENKNALIYGEGGSIGGAVAREFSETFSWETLAAVDSKSRMRQPCGALSRA